MPLAETREPEQIYHILKRLAPFRDLDEELLQRIAADAIIRRYAAGDYVFYQGEKSKGALFIVIEGEARIVAAESQPGAAAGYRRTGDFFGESVFLSDEPYPASVVADRDLTCLLISQKSFEEALSSSYAFAGYFTKALTTRLKELYQTFLFEPAEKDLLAGQPLRKRVRELLIPAVVTCLPLTPVRQVARIMSRANVSSVVVVAPNQKPLGIITEKDLVARVLAAEEPRLDSPALEIMSGRLITVAPDDFAYQALFLMIKHKIKHVPVIDESQKLCGIITVQDLVRNRNTGALTIVDRIEQQEKLKDLAAMMKEIDQVQQALINERAYASEICSLVTELYDRITRKVIYLAERDLRAEGRGGPPSDYCFINMGSSGRKEQYARTDQDNGIIYRDVSPGGEQSAEDYFLALGEKIVAGLEACGFKRCKGDVMANNRRWCKPLSRWCRDIKEWVDRPEPDHIRNMTIFLDFRPLLGDRSLYEDLKDYVTRLFRNAAHALLFLAEDDLKHRVPLNMFKQIITVRTGRYRKKINLKSAASVHILDCVRLFALREGIRETNTFERIRRLKERGVFKADEADMFQAAYETLLMLRIRDSLHKIKLGREPDNFINPGTLSRKEQALLKESLLVVNRLQMLTGHAFRVQNP